MSALTPVEAVTRELDYVAGFPAMDELGYHYSRMRRVLVAALELAKAYESFEELWGLTEDDRREQYAARANSLLEARDRLQEALKS